MGAVCLFLFFLHIYHKSCDKTRGLVLWQNVHSFSQVAALWVCPFLLHGTRGEIITELLLFCLAFPKVSISTLRLGAFYSPRKGLRVFFEEVHPFHPSCASGWCSSVHSPLLTAFWEFSQGQYQVKCQLGVQIQLRGWTMGMVLIKQSQSALHMVRQPFPSVIKITLSLSLSRETCL